MRKSIIVGFCIILFIQGCITNDSHKPENVKIHFAIDSFIVYPAKNILLDKFIFSPIAEYNKIWTINSGNSHELDLALGTWTLLSEKYDEDFKGRLNESRIWKDTLTNEVFISLYPNSLLHFSPPKDTFIRYPIREVTAVLNTKDTILAGTPNGLFYINKHGKNISIAPGFPFDFRVNAIEVYNEDTLLINHGGLFYPARLNQPGRMTKHVDQSPPVYNNPYLDMLPRNANESHYNICHDGHFHFYYADNHLFFQDSANTLFEVELKPLGALRQIMTDELYLYMLYTDAFVIMNKAYATKIARVFDLGTYQKMMKDFQEEFQKLTNDGLDSFLLQYYRLKNDSVLLSDPMLKNKFDGLTRDYLCFLYPEDRFVDVEASILKNELPPELEKYALVGLCMRYLKVCNLDKVEMYTNQLMKEYPGFEYYGSHQVLDCAKKIKYSMDSLRQLELADDEFIYKETLLKEKWVYCGWSGDSYYDFTIVNDNYRKLLSRYPKSKYADDVEFYFIAGYDFNDEGGEEYSEEQIERWSKFIRKYPDSDLITRVRMQMASNFNSYTGTIDTIIEMKQKALAELQKIDIWSISDTNMVNSIEGFKTSIPHQINQLCFQLKVIPKKTAYTISEDLVFTAVLKNRTSKTRKLWLHSKDSYFGSWIYPGNELTFIPKGEVTDTTMKLVSILPMDSLVQEIILNRNIRHPVTMEPGKYVFKQPGLYLISLHESRNEFQSEQAKFYLNK